MKELGKLTSDYVTLTELLLFSFARQLSIYNFITLEKLFIVNIHSYYVFHS